VKVDRDQVLLMMQEAREAELITYCQIKAETLREILKDFFEKCLEAFKVLQHSKIHSVDVQNEPDKVDCQIIFNEIISADYIPPLDPETLVNHAYFLWEFYAGVSLIPMSQVVVSIIDIAAFKILVCLGQLKKATPRFCLELRKKESVQKGKQDQKTKTLDSIMKAYQALGATWQGAESKKPILIKNDNVSLHKLAGKISVCLGGAPTQKHIADCLKELHKKRDI